VRRGRHVASINGRARDGEGGGGNTCIRINVFVSSKKRKEVSWCARAIAHYKTIHDIVRETDRRDLLQNDDIGTYLAVIRSL